MSSSAYTATRPARDGPGNPSLKVNSALLSPAQVYGLQPLAEPELRTLFGRACKVVLADLQFDAPAIDMLVRYAEDVLK